MMAFALVVGGAVMPARAATSRSGGLVRFEGHRAKAIADRTSGSGYECAIRVAVGAETPAAAREITRAVEATFASYSSQNEFALGRLRFSQSAVARIERRSFPRVGALLLAMTVVFSAL